MLGRSTTTTVPTPTLTPTPTPRCSRRTVRHGARASSAPRAKTQSRDDGGDGDGDGGFGEVKMRGRWVSRVTKDSYARARSGWRRTRTHAAANGDAVGESGVAVDGERIVVRARRWNEIRLFHSEIQFFLSEIIRFDSIRLEEDPCVVFDRLTDDFYDGDFVSFCARLNRRDYARVWITNSRTGAPTRRVERLAIFRVFSRRR